MNSIPLCQLIVHIIASMVRVKISNFAIQFWLDFGIYQRGKAPRLNKKRVNLMGQAVILEFFKDITLKNRLNVL